MKNIPAKIRSVVTDIPLMGASAALVFTSAALWQGNTIRQPVVDQMQVPLGFQYQKVQQVLKEAPKAPVVGNTACGPKETFRNVVFLCSGQQPYGVKIDTVSLLWADPRGQEIGKVVCTAGENCRPLDALRGEDLEAGFDWWKDYAFQPR